MKIGIIGAGNMGQALAGGILKTGKVRKNCLRISDIDGYRLRAAKKALGVTGLGDNRKLAEWADIVVLAVKPGVLGAVLAEISSSVSAKKLVISIAAGIRTENIEKNLNGNVPVVRAMPNTPALVNQGVTAVCKGRFARGRHLETARVVFSAVGTVVKVSESMMDAVTALSGSGAAYLFYFTEVMEEAGKQLGLLQKMVEKLVRHTVLGAARMVTEKGAKPAELRKKVTSPGGTTEAAMNCLRKGHFKEVVVKAIQEAARRSRELGGKSKD